MLFVGYQAPGTLGHVINAVISQLQAQPEECFFWATHSGAELDLLVVRGRQRLGFEFKRGTTPGVTRSMRVAMSDLGLRRLWVIHVGERAVDLGRQVRAIPLPRIVDELQPLR